MPRGRTEKTMAMVAECWEILEANKPASIRGVCYQLFTRGLIPDMSKTSTNRISNLLARAREHVDIPWYWIVDEHRAGEQVPSWTDPQAFADATLNRYRVDRWQHQPRIVEVWSKKGTIRGHPHAGYRGHWRRVPGDARL